MLKIVFMGSPDFAVPSLYAVHRSEHKILAVVTNPDKRRGRGSSTSPTIVKKTAVDLGYPVIETDSTKDPAFVNALQKLQADLFVVVAFRILPPQILKIPELGAINLHASLLPEYRGAAPIHHAILDGKEETGCSVFLLNERVDTGNILGQTKIRIGLNETTGELYDRLKATGADLLIKTIDRIDKGDIKGIPQDDAKATAAPKVHPEDGKIDFSETAQKAYNRIRAMTPYPGAWAIYADQKLKIIKSGLELSLHLKEGELHFRDGRLYAGCRSGSVELIEVQLPGKSSISGQDFANGYDLSHGLR